MIFDERCKFFLYIVIISSQRIVSYRNENFSELTRISNYRWAIMDYGCFEEIFIQTQIFHMEKFAKVTRVGAPNLYKRCYCYIDIRQFPFFSGPDGGAVSHRTFFLRELYLELI